MKQLCMRIASVIPLAFISLLALTGPVAAQSLDQTLSDIFAPLGSALSSFVFYEIEVNGVAIPLVVIWMVIPLFMLTIYFGFANIKPRSFKQAWKVLRGRYHDPAAPGEVTQFQALSTALSGTIGIGNIAGVAIAIAWGGPGATFWMILIGLGAMSVKFAEATLGVKYREEHADGTVSGGPMYYLKNGLKARGWPKLGLFLAFSYAIVGIPTLLQWATVNQMFSQFRLTTGFQSGAVFGVILAALTAAVILGGIKSIAKVTARLVPFMAGIYLITALGVIAFHIGGLPDAVLTIITGAFSPEAVEGGILGVIIVGMRRAVYSTEAGLGTSSMAHSAAKTREPASEGMVALMEPFIDTIVVSTITALVIILTGAYQLRLEGYDDIQITSAAFTSVIPWFKWLLMVAVLLFGFSTIISWGYYTEKIWTFVVGETKWSIYGFRTIFSIALIPGGVLTATQVFDLIDSLFFMLAVPNVIGLYLLAPVVKAELKSYFARVKSGEIQENKPVISQPAKESAS